MNHKELFINNKFLVKTMADQGKVAYWETVLYKLTPLVFTLTAFLSLSNWVPSLTPYLSNVFTVAMYGWLLIIIGILFLIEMGKSMPQGSRAKFSALIFALMAIASFIMGGLIIAGLQPFQNQTALNVTIALFGMASLLYMFHASYEFIHHKRLMLTVFK